MIAWLLCKLGFHDVERNDLNDDGWLRNAYCLREGCDW